MKKIKARWKGKNIEGIMLQSPYEGIYVIKLSNGYNIGIKKSDLDIIELIDIDEQVKEEKEHEKKMEEKNDIAIIGIGGTIASKVDYNTGAVYPKITAKELKDQFELKDVDVYQLFNIFSEDMQPWHWESIAESVYDYMKDYEGIILLHGTDTMHYTSAALSFALRLNKPLILVGAQRSSDRPSSDNKLNLLNAVYASKLDFGEACICMHASLNDTLCYLHRGTKVRKMHSSRRDAFKSINISHLAEVDYKSNYAKWLLQPIKHEKLELHNGFNDNVALIYYYPGMKESFLKKLSDYDGIVIAGAGLGHISTSLKKVLKELIDSGIFIYMTTQTIYGRVNMNVYSTGRELQEIGVRGNINDMTPETAFVKLSWAMKREKRHEKIDEIMNTNIAGEISERIEI
ncbi:MAG: Glu-tRNA(Gln) amidotransferase subunit GatD [Candidatus Anstonellales archaeon]